MSDNVIQLCQQRRELNPFLAAMPKGDEPMVVSVPVELARSIRLIAGMNCKDPQEFLIDWLKAGFPDGAA